MWWAAAKRGTPVAGIGDEAYMTDSGGAVRKDDAVVMLVLHRTGRAAAPHLPWLLGQVATRL